MREKIYAIAKQYEYSCGCTFHVDINTGYPAVLNDRRLVQKVIMEYKDIVLLEEPEMISEDFAHYLKQVPGVFFFLGTGTGIPLHNSHFDFSEDVLEKGIDNYIRLSKMNWD